MRRVVRLRNPHNGPDRRQADSRTQCELRQGAEEGLVSLNGLALIVEDDPALRVGLCRWLEREGWTVTSAADGCLGFDLFIAASTPPDVVITDVRMPCSDGFSLAHRIRRRRPRLPFVFLTGELDVELPAWLATVPEIRLLRKPLRPQELMCAIRLVLEQAASPGKTP